MEVKKLTLHNVGRFSELEIMLAPLGNLRSNVTVFVGNNGSGKTSILRSLATSLSWLVSRIQSDNRSLIEKRKQLVQTLLLTNSVNPGEGMDDNELIEILIDELSVPVDGKLEAFAPVTINSLRQWISND